MAGAVILGSGREKSVRRRHPWIFAGAVEEIEGYVRNGDTVEVRSADDTRIAVGAWSEHSQIRVRLWAFDPEVSISHDFFRERLVRSIRARGELATQPQSACRLVNAESDGLPGLVVDRYAGTLVLQLLSAGAERWREAFVEILAELFPGATLWERSDVDVRSKEGLEPRAGLLSGTEPPEWIEIEEAGLRFLVDVRRGHKTGFYLDQAENRALVARRSKDRDVLECFAYTGGFGTAALAGGARHVTRIETSAEALALAERHVALNGLDSSRVEAIEDDVFHVLRRFRDSRRTFDLIVLDPPKFAASARQLEGARRGYKDINLLALKLLRPGGLLVTFSCSGHVDVAMLEDIVADAAVDAGRDVRVLRRLGPSEDHPVAITFPEGRYLKGLLCLVD